MNGKGRSAARGVRQSGAARAVAMVLASAAGVVAVLTASPALAQAQFDNIMISGLRMRSSFEGKPDPRMSSEDENAYFYHRRADGKIMGAWLTTSCPQGSGRGRLPFAYAGGADSGSDTCQRSFRSNFRWSSTVRRAGNRIVLDGRGDMDEDCVRGGCGETRATVIERATLRIEGRRCIVESYYREESQIRHGRVGTARKFSSSPRTRCTLQ
jgi:hypothetical protein